MKYALCLVLFPILLAGCVPGSAANLYEGPGGVRTFEVDADVEIVYARITARAQGKYEHDRPLDGGAGAQASIDTTQRTATITIWSSYKTGHYHLVVKLEEIAPRRTRVDISYALSSWASAARQVEKWAKTP